ncbi:MAG: hypothetical protein COY66_04245 [Candidatus Kerfeldbacteria bacterium CG_4_10_14_0_8_um_filter_42_10]|uniref:DUF5667 domain-containing protein n=1 Tax=Candidatus Kerfeldbacteria bacterium CG_4_10_14_0_8_um_filter_42_10 TaxID=2014248 RepID=A0A2M7RHW8_9BACT|nr:MAG: hypothetical protein COY66_04245 [Candidatus Kerfeldbacteria bacterium CG_4_10_14_0_8_um_filter_42_10]
MKKATLIFILLLFPMIALAQSMVEIENSDITPVMEDGYIANVNSPETNETTIVDIDVNLPDIKLLPSSPFYFLKRSWEEVKGWFIFNTNKKIKYGINLANKRLEETETLIQNKKTDLINGSLDRFNQQMEEVNSNITKAKNKSRDLTEIYNLVQQNKERHEAVLNQLQAQVPDNLKEVISNIKDVSQTGFQITKEKIQEGMDILENNLQ